jgi:hypothetical protein
MSRVPHRPNYGVMREEHSQAAEFDPQKVGAEPSRPDGMPSQNANFNQLDGPGNRAFVSTIDSRQQSLANVSNKVDAVDERQRQEIEELARKTKEYEAKEQSNEHDKDGPER